MENAVPNLQRAINELRTFDGVAVLGAGTSFLAGMPLAHQLPPLVWQTLDHFREIGVAVSSELGVSAGTAKKVVGDDDGRIKVAFKHIAGNRTARVCFQKTFASLNRERSAKSSSAHTALARLVHCGRVQHVVSLNWDTLLEVAYLERYGVDINVAGIKMSKPHGDCKRPDEDWVLPHDAGRISEDLVNLLTGLASERPRVLLIIGYSEGDEIVVQRLISPLANRWRVFRISPNANDEGAISLGAQEALEAIAQSLCATPEVEGWDYVTFANQRGIEAAISGERLGSRDVQACPRLANFGAALDRLKVLHNVEILGEAGSGKSITAWQLAANYHAEGYEVLQADATCACSVERRVRSAMQAPGKKVLVVDDTQIFQAGFGHRLSQIASRDTKVILATTDPESHGTGSVRIPARGAVETIAAEFRLRRNEVLETVKRYDPLIGDRYLDIPIERRIEEASKGGTAWQFCFILRGGWHQAREGLSVLRDFDRADVLLAVVAARQLLSLDAGVFRHDLIHDAGGLGKTRDWAERAFNHLIEQSAILNGPQLRCPHIRFAGVVIETFFRNGRDVELASVASLLRNMILDQKVALRGISWLLQQLFQTNSFLLFRDTKDRLLQPEHVHQLFRRCLDATDPIERRDAASLVSNFLGWQALKATEVLAHCEVIRRWLETVGPTEAYAIGFLVNNLYNDDKVAARELVESADFKLIAERLSEVLPSDAYLWGHFLDRCYLAAGDRWRDQLRNAVDRDSIRALMTRFTGLGRVW